MTESAFTHVPVLPRQTIDLLLDGTSRPIRRIIDGTIGCGGHSSLILERLPEAELLGIDRDDEALVRAGERLAFAGNRVHLRKGRFSELAEFSRGLGWDSVDAILLDIGVSSPQIDDPKRGFSFRQDGPLDMRMDRTSELSASRVVNHYDADSLRNLFRMPVCLRRRSLPPERKRHFRQPENSRKSVIGCCVPGTGREVFPRRPSVFRLCGWKSTGNWRS